MIDSPSLDEELTVAVQRRGVAGASLAVHRAGTTRQTAAGTLSVSTRAPASTESIFQIGSITKLWTAAMICQLVEEGSLDLDARLSDLLWVSERWQREISVRDLLSHRSGIEGDFFPDTGRGDDCVEKYVALSLQNHPQFRTGATCSYSNAGDVILGRLIELTCRQSWDDALRERLIEPLGLHSTATHPEDALKFGAAVGHVRSRGGELAPVDDWRLPRAIGPAGGICMSAGDLLEFARAYVTEPNDGSVSRLRRTSMTQLVSHLPYDRRWPMRGWGLGWEIYDWGEVTGFGHGGQTPGQSAYLRIVPEVDAIFVLLTNGGDGRSLFEDMFTHVAREDWGLDLGHYRAAEPLSPCTTIDATGTYYRHSQVLQVDDRAGAIKLITARTDGPPSRPDSDEWDVAVTQDGALRAVDRESDIVSPLSFYQVDNQDFLHFGMRANRRLI